MVPKFVVLCKPISVLSFDQDEQQPISSSINVLYSHVYLIQINFASFNVQLTTSGGSGGYII